MLPPCQRVTSGHRDRRDPQVATQLGDLLPLQVRGGVSIRVVRKSEDVLRAVRCDDSQHSSLFQVDHLVSRAALDLALVILVRFRVQHHQCTVTLLSDLPIFAPDVGGAQILRDGVLTRRLLERNINADRRDFRSSTAGVYLAAHHLRL
jgi:hypothetical protein